MLLSEMYAKPLLDELPENVKNFISKLKLIGEGATTLVYEYNNDSVIMLTRDKAKIRWLIESGLGDLKFKVKSQWSTDLKDIFVYILLVEKLYEVPSDKVDLLFKVVGYIEQLRFSKKGNRFVNIILKSDKKYSLLLHKLFGKVNIQFIDEENFIEFLHYLKRNVKEAGRHFKLDIHAMNLLCDKNGKLILIDPVVSDELLNIKTKFRYDHLDFKPEDNLYKPLKIESKRYTNNRWR